MYICPKCGKQYEKKYAFCEACGTRLEEISEQPGGSQNIGGNPNAGNVNWNPTQGNMLAMTSEQKPKKSKGPLIAVLILVFVVILGAAGVGGYFFWQSRQEDSSAKEAEKDKEKEKKNADSKESERDKDGEEKKELEIEDYIEIADEYLGYEENSLYTYSTEMLQQSDGGIGEVTWQSQDGILSRVVDDFDGDGEMECLVLNLNSGWIKAVMYSFDEDELQAEDSVKLFNESGTMAEAYGVVYLNPMKKGINISCEFHTGASVEMCDGITKTYVNYHYKNGSLLKQVEYEQSGSDWSEIEAPQVADSYLDVDDYYYHDMIYNWNKDRAAALCEITGTVNASYLDYSTISDFVSRNSGLTAECGTRIYEDRAAGGQVRLDKKIKTKATAAKKPAETQEPDERRNEEDGYVLADSSIRYLTQEDLAGLTKDQLRVARNEIYARHGRIFQDQSLQTYFESKSWYTGTIAPEDFQQSMLSDVERANTALISEYENSLP